MGTTHNKVDLILDLDDSLVDEIKEVSATPSEPELHPGFEKLMRKFRELELGIYWAASVEGDLPAIDWIVENLISVGSVTILYGDGGTGKTYATIDLGVCVAMGKDWLNRQTKQGTVLFIDEESGRDRFQLRLKANKRAHNAPADLPFGFQCLQGYDLTKDKDAQRLREAIDLVKPSLVIIDALMDVIGDGDENTTKDIQPLFHKLRVIAADTGVSFIVIHHANRDGSYRGASAMKGAVDLMLRVENPNNAGMLTFTLEKGRDILLQPFKAMMRFGDDSFYLDPTDCVTADAAKILEHLRLHSIVTVSDLVSALKMSEDKVRRALKNLKDKVEELPPLPKTRAKRYQLKTSTP